MKIKAFFKIKSLINLRYECSEQNCSFFPPSKLAYIGSEIKSRLAMIDFVKYFHKEDSLRIRIGQPELRRVQGRI